jgi:hypothetical protein
VPKRKLHQKYVISVTRKILERETQTEKGGYYNTKPGRYFTGAQSYYILLFANSEPGSSVGIATDYGLDGPGIEFQWGRDFPPVQTGPGTHPSSSTMATGSFPGVKCIWGVLLTTHPLLVPRSWKSTAIPLPTLCATRGL